MWRTLRPAWISVSSIPLYLRRLRWAIESTSEVAADEGAGREGGAVQAEQAPDLRRGVELLCDTDAYKLLVDVGNGVASAIKSSVGKIVRASVYPKRPLFEKDKISWPIKATRVTSARDVADLAMVVSNPDFEISKILYLAKDGRIVGSSIISVGHPGVVKQDFGYVALGIPDSKEIYGVVL